MAGKGMGTDSQPADAWRSPEWLRYPVLTSEVSEALRDLAATVMRLEREVEALRNGR